MRDMIESIEWNSTTILAISLILLGLMVVMSLLVLMDRRKQAHKSQAEGVQLFEEKRSLRRKARPRPQQAAVKLFNEEADAVPETEANDSGNKSRLEPRESVQLFDEKKPRRTKKAVRKLQGELRLFDEPPREAAADTKELKNITAAAAENRPEKTLETSPVLELIPKKEQQLSVSSGEAQQTVSGDVSYTIRPLRSDETELLEDFLYEAIFQSDESSLLPREVIHQPEISVYINNWGQKDDLCLVAEADGKVVGAVWTRILAGSIKGYGNIDDTTPEFAISLYKPYRGKGIGKALIKSMIALLREKGYGQASLSVDKNNYALKLYQKVGFEILREQEHDVLMLLRLQP